MVRTSTTISTRVVLVLVLVVNNSYYYTAKLQLLWMGIIASMHYMGKHVNTHHLIIIWPYFDCIGGHFFMPKRHFYKPELPIVEFQYILQLLQYIATIAIYIGEHQNQYCNIYWLPNLPIYWQYIVAQHWWDPSKELTW